MKHNTCKHILLLTFILISILFSACKHYYEFDVFNHTWKGTNINETVVLELIGYSDGFNEMRSADENGIVTAETIEYALKYYEGLSTTPKVTVKGVVVPYTYSVNGFDNTDVGLGFSDGFRLRIDKIDNDPMGGNPNYLDVTYSNEALNIKGSFTASTDTYQMNHFLYRAD